MIRLATVLAAAGLLLTLTESAEDKAGPTYGTVVAATWQDGTLLVRTPDRFPLLAAGTADIRDPQNRVVGLANLRAGDRVDYNHQTWAGMSIATTVRVAPHVAASAK